MMHGTTNNTMETPITPPLSQHHTARMSVITVPMWDDNYAYLLVDEATLTCAAVDPSQPEKVRITLIKVVEDRPVYDTHADHTRVTLVTPIVKPLEHSS
jgi:hypothetical protein